MPRSSGTATPWPRRPRTAVALVKYGQTYQGKDLNYLIITSPENLKAIETIRDAQPGAGRSAR